MSEERPFADKSKRPDASELVKVLNTCYPFFSKIIEMTNRFNKQWHYYKSSGWLFKITDKKKALFYLIPLENSFNVNLTIREGERWAFLKDKDLEMLNNKIENAVQYPEGFLMQFSITDAESFGELLPLAEKLVAIREKREVI